MNFIALFGTWLKYATPLYDVRAGGGHVVMWCIVGSV